MAETPKSTGVGFKFNSTGTDDTSTEILEPQVDSAAKTRRLLLIAVIAVAILGMLGVSFLRNPISMDDLFGRRKGPIFQAPTDHRPE